MSAPLIKHDPDTGKILVRTDVFHWMTAFFVLAILVAGALAVLLLNIVLK